MRNSELKTGIEVFDEKGEVVGTFKVACKEGEPRCAYACVAMHFIVVVKCGVGNHTAFPMQTGGRHYRGHGPVSCER